MFAKVTIKHAGKKRKGLELKENDFNSFQQMLEKEFNIPIENQQLITRGKKLTAENIYKTIKKNSKPVIMLVGMLLYLS